MPSSCSSLADKLFPFGLLQAAWPAELETLPFCSADFR